MKALEHVLNAIHLRDGRGAFATLEHGAAHQITVLADGVALRAPAEVARGGVEGRAAFGAREALAMQRLTFEREARALNGRRALHAQAHLVLGRVIAAALTRWRSDVTRALAVEK